MFSLIVIRDDFKGNGRVCVVLRSKVEQLESERCPSCLSWHTFSAEYMCPRQLAQPKQQWALSVKSHFPLLTLTLTPYQTLRETIETKLITWIIVVPVLEVEQVKHVEQHTGTRDWDKRVEQVGGVIFSSSSLLYKDEHKKDSLAIFPPKIYMTSSSCD